MSNGAIVVLGNISAAVALDAASRFGWSVEHVDTFDQLAQLNRQRRIVAVLFDQSGLTWRQALETVIEAAPQSLPILCHRFSEEPDWTQCAAAGAFHKLSLPLNAAELLQSLGFVWARLQTEADYEVPHRKSGVQGRNRVRHSTPKLRAIAQRR